LNDPGTLRFILLVSMVEPWSPSNAVAQFDVLFSVPLEVVH